MFTLFCDSASSTEIPSVLVRTRNVILLHIRSMIESLGTPTSGVRHLKERILNVQSEDRLVNSPCTACEENLITRDQAVICPRCRSVHHLECWVDRGGCSRRGCQQVVDPRLLPPKQPEKPIERSKTPRRVIVIVAILIIAGTVGLYRNAQKSRLIRSEQIAVMVSSLEPKDLWENVVMDLNANETITKRAELYYVPHGPGGTSYEQKYIVMTAAREAPEVIVLEYPRFDMYAEQNLLVPLDDVIQIFAQRGIPLDPVELDRFTVGGKLLGLPHPDPEKPFAISVSVLSINPEDGKEALFHIYKSLIPPSDDSTE